MAGRIDQFDLGYAEFKAPVGCKMFSKLTKIHVWSSGKKSGIKVPTQEWVGPTAADRVWDGLTKKE